MVSGNEGEEDTSLHHLQRKRDGTRPPRKCYRCGDESHLANTCPLRNAVCDVCKMTGHISRACRNKEKVRSRGFTAYIKHCECIREEIHDDRNTDNNELESDAEEDIYYIHSINGVIKPYITQLLVTGHNVEFEIDTGAGVTIMSEET